MNLFSRIWFPVTVMAAATAGVFGIGEAPVQSNRFTVETVSPAQDTVKYPRSAWKLHRKGDFELISISDSLLRLGADSLNADDTLPHLTARDTVKVPDSLRFTDPFRYKYYVALFDSLTHAIVRDSLKKRVDSLTRSSKSLFIEGDRDGFERDSLLAAADSITWYKVDSIYFADSTAVAKAKFLKWYNSLDKKSRKAYDAKVLLPIKMAEMDSIRKAKEDAQAIKDSIIEYTPRILDTYAIPDSLFYKRIITWTTEPYFNKMDVHVPDTTYNYHYYDYPWQRKDVNATWLGVSGSAVQYYNYFNRQSRENVSFYDALEAWSFDPGNLPNYNTKTPYTELGYTGTLLAGDSKESDNIHIFTTQNITPAFNFGILYDRYGGKGVLTNEETKNKTLAINANYLGKKYLMHAGYIRNNVQRDENGGIQDNKWIRDTTVEPREIPINLNSAGSQTIKNTVYLEQQFRIPFDFINKIKARKDSTFKWNPDSLDRDITTAYVGHSSEFSSYMRNYYDAITLTETAGREFYHNVFNYSSTAADDTMKVAKLDNKVYLRLQPWASDAIVSKLDVGVGDYFKQYRDSCAARPLKVNCNTFYLYAGAEGQVKNYFHWDASGRYNLFGYDAADFAISANASTQFYPFRTARKSPVIIGAHFETSLTAPTYYEMCVNTNHYSWNFVGEYGKKSVTKIQGNIDIPHWDLHVKVGYALLANTLYYDTLSVCRQKKEVTNVLSAALTKNFTFGPVHLDNSVLLQYSSDQSVVPVPLAAFNLRWYLQFVLQRDESKTKKILEMQVGINAFYNTQWYSPAWNPNLGVFYNQRTNLYENGPYFDVFVNMQWKRCCLFIKYQNAGEGWPMRDYDYFSADHYAVTRAGLTGLKIGIFWPFYTQPGKAHSHNNSGALPKGGRL